MDGSRSHDTRSLPPLPEISTTIKPSPNRHLKRFSLSNSSPLRDFPSSPTLTTSYNSSNNGSPRTGPRPLRLSNSIPNLKDFTTVEDSPTSSIASSAATVTLPNLSEITITSRASPSMNGRMRGGGHARKGSSISYSTSSDNSINLMNSPSSSSRPRADSGTSLSSPSSDRFQSSNRVGLRGLEEEGEEQEEGESNGFLGNSRNIGASIGAAPTLSEMHVDLLSFIAKKERLCLDLREELKRHDEDLKVLKRKWESIVAKSIATPSAPSRTSLESTRASNRLSLSTAPFIAPEMDKPLPSNSPRTTNFDSIGEFEYNPSSVAELELGESVQAAKKWVGGVFSTILGIPEGEEDRLEGDLSSKGLNALTEEEEEEEDGHKRLNSINSLEGKRNSISSLSSIGHDSFKNLTRHLTGEVTVIEPSPSSSSLTGLSTSEEEGSTERMRKAQGPPRVKQMEGHSRRRSTFDMLGSAGLGGWNSMTKRLTGLTESETFKNSTKKALDTLNHFEKTLTDTLGPLDPPSRPSSTSTSPTFSPPTQYRDLGNPIIPGLLSNSIGLGSWNQAAPLSANQKSKSKAKDELDEERTPKATQEEFDFFAINESPIKVSSPKKLNSLELIDPIVPSKKSPVLSRNEATNGDEWGAWE